ncbi:hypothetical protein [Pseudomonas fluorescens]|nr:hypothetical protein [Pseudomonas fluorescens]
MNQLSNISKPKIGAACNGCGYCCTVEPCMLAQEFLHCENGPCDALEAVEGKAICGLVRNPLGYLYKAAHPEADVSVLDAAPNIQKGHELSVEFAAALGVGQGCDAADDEAAAAWPVRIPTRSPE